MSDTFDDEIESVVSESEVELGRLGALSADLTSYATALEELRCVNYKMAVSIESVCPGTIPANYPLASYTQANSKINYNVTLEGISESLNKITKSIIESIVNFFRKVGEFFMRLWGVFASREKRQEEVRAKTRASQKEVQYLLTNAPVSAKKFMEIAMHESRLKEDSIFEKELDEINRELLHSIIRKDHAHRAVHAMGSGFSEFLKTIYDRAVLLEAEIRVIDAHPEQVREASYTIRKETDTVKFHSSQVINELRALHILKGGEYTPTEFADSLSVLKDRISDLYNHKASHRPTLADIRRSDATATFMEQPEKIGGFYDRLSYAVNNLDKHSSVHIDRIMHSALIHLAALIRSEYHAATNFLSVANMYASVAMEVITLEYKIQMNIENQVRKVRQKGYPLD